MTDIVEGPIIVPDEAPALYAEITRLRAEVVQASQQLGNILAIIHGDGGHHTADVGIDQSVNDAHIKWASLITENERLRAALREIIADSFSVYAIEVARAALEEK